MDQVKRKFIRKALLVCSVGMVFGNFFISNALKSHYVTTVSELAPHSELAPQKADSFLGRVSENLSAKARESEERIAVPSFTDNPSNSVFDVSIDYTSNEDSYDSSDMAEFHHSSGTSCYSDEESSKDSTEQSSDDSTEESLCDEFDDVRLESDDYADLTSDLSYDAIIYSEQDLFMFEATMYCEGGAQGTSREIQVANAWLARNKIVQEIKNGSEDPFRAALNPNHYQGVYDDDYDGWRAVSQEEGVITQDLIDSNPSIHEICIGVLSGEIESPIYDWDCTQCFDYFDFDDGAAFAEDVGITQYIIIENGIYFPSSEWTERLTWYCLNY